MVHGAPVSIRRSQAGQHHLWLLARVPLYTLAVADLKAHITSWDVFLVGGQPFFKDAAICKGASAATITAPGDNQDRLGDIAAMGLAASVSGLLGMCTWTPVCGLGWALTTKGVYAR
jgi:hypothetical protein